ncbi:MAG: hypothetical protein V4597_14490 [Pseudomonadota bacterium]
MRTYPSTRPAAPKGMNDPRSTGPTAAKPKIVQTTLPNGQQRR